MAVINLENIAATASITIQLIKDYSMYESEIISSNGTIFQSTDTDTTLTFRAYKGIEEITNKMTTIEWSKFYFKDDELIEDSIWGQNKKNLKKIVLNKEDIEDKSIIQASGYSMIDGNLELVTTARITMIKISDIFISDITPIDPSDKMMWMDTNQVPPTLKIWSNELGYWITSGMDVPIIKNLIRNSNFWAEIDGYYTINNAEFLEPLDRYSSMNKQWLTLVSKPAGESAGISQEIEFPIVKNSNYIFSFLAYRQSTSWYNGKNISVKITSIDNKNTTTTLVDENYELKSNVSTIEVPFVTKNDTEKIIIYIGTQRRSLCYFYITELSLYNSSVYYPWELCPEDIDKQMNTKLDNSRQSVFNTFVDNGAYKAIYESGGQYYIRTEYMVPEVPTKVEFTELANKVNQIASTCTTMKNDITILQSTVSTLGTKLNELESKYNTLESKYNTLQDKYNTLDSKHNTDITALTESISDLVKRIEKLEKPDQPINPESPTE